MKSTNYFSRLMLIAAASIAMGSCSTNTADTPFQIYQPSIYAYIIQGQSGTTTFFTPVISFETISSTSTIVSGDVLLGSASMGGRLFLDAVVETPFNTNAVDRITDLNGSYTLKATDNKNKPATYNFNLTSFETTDAMDLGAGVEELDVEDFDYSGNTITASIAAVGNATGYLFIMVPVFTGSKAPVYSADIQTLVAHESSSIISQTSELRQTITWPFGSRNYYYDYWIYPAAVKANISLGKIVLIIGKGKLLLKNSTGFQELPL